MSGKPWVKDSQRSRCVFLPNAFSFALSAMTLCWLWRVTVEIFFFFFFRRSSFQLKALECKVTWQDWVQYGQRWKSGRRKELCTQKNVLRHPVGNVYIPTSEFHQLCVRSESLLQIGSWWLLILPVCSGCGRVTFLLCHRSLATRKAPLDCRNTRFLFFLLDTRSQCSSSAQVGSRINLLKSLMSHWLGPAVSRWFIDCFYLHPC